MVELALQRPGYGRQLPVPYRAQVPLEDGVVSLADSQARAQQRRRPGVEITAPATVVRLDTVRAVGGVRATHESADSEATHRALFGSAQFLAQAIAQHDRALGPAPSEAAHGLAAYADAAARAYTYEGPALPFDLHG